MNQLTSKKKIQSQNNDLNPDWAAARLHARANKVGKLYQFDEELIDNKEQICLCCKQPINKKPLDLCANTKELDFLGSGFPLYFIFLKYCILILLIESTSYCFLSIYWGVTENHGFCQENEQRISKWTGQIIQCTGILMEMSRISNQFEISQSILRLGSFLIHLIMLVYVRNILVKTNAYYDQIATSFSDFAIMIKNLPQKIKIKQYLVNLMKNFFQSPKQIYDLILIGDFEFLENIEKEKKNIVQLKKKYYAQKEKQMNVENSSSLFQIEQKIALLNVQLQQLQQKRMKQIAKAKSQIQSDEMVCERAIFCVNSDFQKQKIIKLFNRSSLRLRNSFFGSENNDIKMEEAPNPCQIIWANLRIPLKVRIKNEIIGWVVTIILLGVITGFFYLIQYYHSQLLINQSIKHKTGLSLFIAYSKFFIVIILNKFFISSVLYKICLYQKYSTKGKEQFSFTLKYSVATFFTTAVMTLLLQDITHHNIYDQSFGVVDSESVMFFLNSFFVPLIWLVNPIAIVRNLIQKRYEGKKYFTQAEANQMMEDSNYQIGKRYAEILQILWFSYLYQPLIPVGPPVACIGVFLYYWVDKYNLLRRSVVKQNLSGYLTFRTMTLLDLTLLFRPIGQLIFDYQIRDTYSSASIIYLSLGFVYLLLPINSILSYFHKEKFKYEEKLYTEVRKRLGPTYKMFHPLFCDDDEQIHKTISEKYMSQLKNIFFNRVISKGILSNFQNLNNEKKMSFAPKISKQDSKKQQLLYKSNFY